MKLRILSAVLIVGLGFAACTPSKEKIKKDFVKTCMTGMGVQTDTKMKEMMQEYCECAAEKAVDKFSVKELKEFDKMPQSEVQAKIMPVIQGCLDELTQKAQAYQQSKAQ